MLSLTFCSLPERVWMTNHWLRMSGLKFYKQEEKDMVHHERENAEQRDRNHDHDRRPLQFVPSGPRAFFQLFPRLLHVSGQALELPLPPKETKDRARDHHPDQNFRCLVHKCLSGGEVGIRTPVPLARKAVFKTAA